MSETVVTHCFDLACIFRDSLEVIVPQPCIKGHSRASVHEL